MVGVHYNMRDYIKKPKALERLRTTDLKFSCPITEGRDPFTHRKWWGECIRPSEALSSYLTLVAQEKVGAMFSSTQYCHMTALLSAEHFDFQKIFSFPEQVFQRGSALPSKQLHRTVIHVSCPLTIFPFR